MQFPEKLPDTRCVDQAKHQAARLSDWLSKAVGEPIKVQPVLTLPGWFVERKGRGEVMVMNAKEAKCLAGGRKTLDETIIARIIHQLDQRCRDVEF